MLTDDEREERMVLEILKHEIRLVARPDYEETETWMVKPGCLERCAKLIVETLRS
jgi:hypothetical protein